MTPFYDLKDDLINFPTKVVTEKVEDKGKKVEDTNNRLDEEIIDDHSDKTTQYLTTALVTIGAFSAGTFLSWTSSAFPLLRADQHAQIGATEESWIASLLNLGAFFGAIPTGLLAERFGRKNTLLYLSLPMVISWLMIALSTSVYCLYVGRFVGGIAVGALSVAVPPYVAELAQPGVRAALAQISQIQLTSGILAGYVAGLSNSVTILSLVLLVFPILFYLVGFHFIPESPVYLLSQGKEEDARNSLIYLRGAGCNIDTELKTMQTYIKECISKDGTFRDLISSDSNIKAMIVAYVLMILQQLTGITTVIFFLGPILEYANLDPHLTVVIGVTQVLSTFIAANLFTKKGRRPMMIASNLIMSVSIFLLGLYFQLRAIDYVECGWWIPLLCLSLYISSYSIGAGPMPWLMLRELFPISIRRKATAISAGVNWFMAFVMTGYFHTMISAVHIAWVLCCYSFFCVISALFVYHFVPETKGKNVDEVHREFSRKGRWRHRHIIEIESISTSSIAIHV